MGNDRLPPTGGKPTRLVPVAAGPLALGLGIAEVFLSLLPTTPFVLPAAACWGRSSQARYDRASRSKWPDRCIRDCREQRGITAAAKVPSISVLWLSIGYCALFAVERMAILPLLPIAPFVLPAAA